MKKYDVSHLDGKTVYEVLQQMKRTSHYNICNPDLNIVGTINDKNDDFMKDLETVWENTFKKGLLFSPNKKLGGFTIEEINIKDVRKSENKSTEEKSDKGRNTTKKRKLFSRSKKVEGK